MRGRKRKIERQREEKPVSLAGHPVDGCMVRLVQKLVIIIMDNTVIKYRQIYTLLDYMRLWRVLVY